MAFGFNFGGSSSSQKGHSWIDPATRALQEQNYNGILGLPGYQPTSAEDIARYYSPYEQDVVNSTMGDLEHQRQMAVNSTGDAAQRARAFGGSRHGVAEALTNGEFSRAGGLLFSQLRDQGFRTALGAATGENQFGYQGLLSKYGLGNQALGLITPEQFSKGKTTGLSFGVGGQWGK